MTRKAHSRRQFLIPIFFAASIALAGAILAPASLTQENTFQIDPARTTIEFALGSTLHTVHGTFTLKSSAIRFNPTSETISGAIVVDATSGQTGNSGRDARMHREILESAKFPDIVFTTTKIKGALPAEGTSELQVSGQLRLCGTEHEVTLPVEVKAEGQNLKISAHFDIPYVQWGLKNPSNFLLHVSDKVAIDIHASGRMHSGENP
jgi:polyisoprenoid-binding protein YceI